MFSLTYVTKIYMFNLKKLRIPQLFAFSACLNFFQYNLSKSCMDSVNCLIQVKGIE